uniref:Uncharacterized protein n=1 Tax=Trypanosoma congolense (strain IL3000) TaxID=1068625 RepID=G0UMP4_TRYCI|nr:hypothetical protein, unlikely [Trypanosoma congolense IL3000]
MHQSDFELHPYQQDVCGREKLGRILAFNVLPPFFLKFQQYLAVTPLDRALEERKKNDGRLKEKILPGRNLKPSLSFPHVLLCVLCYLPLRPLKFWLDLP